MSLLQGVGVLAMVLAVFAIALGSGSNDTQARTVAFVTLVMGNLGLILGNLSRSESVLAVLRARNAALTWVSGAALGLLSIVLYVPFVRDLFGFAQASPADLALGVGVGLASVLWCEALKRMIGKSLGRGRDDRFGGSGPQRHPAATS